MDAKELAGFLKEHTNKQASEFFGVSIRTISRKRKQYNLTHESVKYPSDLTEDQLELVKGSLLGDGCVERKQCRFKIKQTSTRKEYVDWIYEKLSPFSIFLKETSSTIKNKKHYSWQMATCAHSNFKKIRNEWYEGVQKIIPKDLILTEKMFAHWHVQDGCNHQRKKYISLHTNSFTVDDVSFLIEVLKRDLGISATLNFHKKQPTIYIGSYEYCKAVEILKPHISWSCFEYKTDTSNVPIKKNENLGSCKLNSKLAQEIRSLYDMGTDVKSLSVLYKVSIASIYNVINYYTYKKENKTSANISVVYNPNS